MKENQNELSIKSSSSKFKAFLGLIKGNRGTPQINKISLLHIQIKNGVEKSLKRRQINLNNNNKNTTNDMAALHAIL